MSSLMEVCEILRKIRDPKTKVFVGTRWVQEKVANIAYLKPKGIRCAYCHGAITILREGSNGQAPHAEHCSPQDSEGCQGGHHFQGVHKMSLNPVE